MNAPSTVAAIYARKNKFADNYNSIANQTNLCKHCLTENLNIEKFFIYKDEGFLEKTTNDFILHT